MHISFAIAINKKNIRYIKKETSSQKRTWCSRAAPSLSPFPHLQRFSPTAANLSHCVPFKRKLSLCRSVFLYSLIDTYIITCSIGSLTLWVLFVSFGFMLALAWFCSSTGSLTFYVVRLCFAATLTSARWLRCGSPLVGVHSDSVARETLKRAKRWSALQRYLKFSEKSSKGFRKQYLLQQLSSSIRKIRR